MDAIVQDCRFPAGGKGIGIFIADMQLRLKGVNTPTYAPRSYVFKQVRKGSTKV